MAKKEPSKLQQAKQLVGKEIDRIISEICQRAKEHALAPQRRRELTACLASDLAVLDVVHNAIIQAQQAGMKKADAALRQALLELLNLYRHAVINFGEGHKLAKSAKVLFMWSDKERFIELIS